MRTGTWWIMVPKYNRLRIIKKEDAEWMVVGDMDCLRRYCNHYECTISDVLRTFNTKEQAEKYLEKYDSIN